MGTGPAGGTRHGQTGKSKRLESSLLIKSTNHRILIDVTQNFIEQCKKIDRIDAIFITHAHLDAIGGIKDLTFWQEKHGIKKIPLYSLPKTIEKIKKHFPKTNLQFVPVTNLKIYEMFGIKIRAFPVRHSMTQGFPTLGFYFEKDKKSFAYASDTCGWSKKSQALMQRADILIIDGAMWHKKMPSHLDLPEILPTLCTWPNKKIIFTQIGNTAPDFEIIFDEIRKMCNKAEPAYDGMVSVI